MYSLIASAGKLVCSNCHHRRWNNISALGPALPVTAKMKLESSGETAISHTGSCASAAVSLLPILENQVVPASVDL